MPITLTYDIAKSVAAEKNANSRDHAYIRSALERFHWRKIGKSVFLYAGSQDGREDWLNHVVPALMFLRAYVVKNEMTLNSFTVQAHSLSWIETPGVPSGEELEFATPSDPQSSERDLRAFVNSCTAAAPRLGGRRGR